MGEMEEAEAGGGGDQRSVYFDGGQGVWKCRHCIWTYQLSGPGIDHIQKHEGCYQLVMDVETLTRLGTYFDSPIKGIGYCDGIDEKNKSTENGKTYFTTKEFNNQENNPLHEDIQNSKNANLEIGSYSHLSSEKCSENGIRRSELEIEENVQVRLVENSKLEATEIDLEKVLDEQDTHDLYCPNCNSCITKRVILRKRKRTVREIHFDAPPAKVQQVQHDLVAATGLDEMTELGHQREPDIFRCLSCFSFFIPTEDGFNIFRIFDKREESENLQTSQHLPVKKTNWFASIFKPVTDKKNESETGIPLPTDDLFNFGEQMEDAAHVYNYSTTTTSTSISGVIVHEGQNDIGQKINDAEIQARLPDDSYASSIEQTDDPPQKEKHDALAQTLPRDKINGNLQTNIREKLDNAILNNDAGIPLPTEDLFNFGEQTEDAAHVYNYSTTTTSTSISGVIVHEGQNDIGQEINDAEIQDCLPDDSYASNIEQTDDPSQKEKHDALAQTLPGDKINGNLQTNITEKLDNAILNNDAGIPLPTEDLFNIGEQMEDAAHVYNYRTTTTSTSISGVIVHEGQNDIGQKINDVFKINDAGEKILKPASMVKPTFPEGSSQITQNIRDSITPVILPLGETQIYVGEQIARKTGRGNDWDVLKSIVYGGLIESITSLGVVSSAAGADATTLNIVALGLANLIGGLFVIAHDLSELRSTQDEATDQNGEPISRYWELLGRKRNFRMHATVAILTYIVAGLLPPLIYGFSFRKSNDKEYKLIAVAVSSLVSIALLAIGKAHVLPERAYFKFLFYYLGLGVSASGLSLVAGVMINRLLIQLGLFDSSAAAPAPPSIVYREMSSIQGSWSSY